MFDWFLRCFGYWLQDFRCGTFGSTIVTEIFTYNCNFASDIALESKSHYDVGYVVLYLLQIITIILLLRIMHMFIDESDPAFDFIFLSFSVQFSML